MKVSGLPDAGYIEFSCAETKTSRPMRFCVVPDFRATSGGEHEVSASSKGIRPANRLHASWLSWFLLDFYGGGEKNPGRLTEVLTSVMKGSSKEVFGAAGTKAALKGVTVELNLDEGLELFNDVGTSWSGFGNMVRKLRQLGVPCTIPSVAKIQACLKEQGVICDYNEMELEGKTGPVEAVVFTANALDVACRDWDNMKRSGEYANCNFTCNGGSERLSLVAGQDKGGFRSKFTICAKDRSLGRCSPRATSLVATYEALRSDVDAPTDNYANFSTTLK